MVYAFVIKVTEGNFVKKNIALIIAVEMDIAIVIIVIVIKIGLELHAKKLLAQMTAVEMEFA